MWQIPLQHLLTRKNCTSPLQRGKGDTPNVGEIVRGIRTAMQTALFSQKKRLYTNETQRLQSMKPKYSILSFALLLCINVFSQNTSWTAVKIDENLVVSVPQTTERIDTAFSKDDETLKFRILKAETAVSTLGVTVTPNGTGLNVDDEESLKTALKGIEDGTYKRAKEKGFTCKSKDTVLDGVACKKFEFFNSYLKDPVIYNYSFLVNDRLYMFTIAPLHLNYDKAKLLDDAARFLSSIHFTKSIKEKQFATKAESNAYKFGYYLVPFLLIAGVIAFVVIKIARS